ncbi:MAG TPA: efflux RND transporter periplasmic adaptor subunit [Thermoanaerobaculia bacterium]|nr:efflux RND transporter periplasmic adaptor subunit [Thermoanaerobaculia bacterium]
MTISSRANLLSSTTSGDVAKALAQRVVVENERPALRKDMIVRNLVQMGESKWLVKNPETLAIFSFNDAEWGLISLFDGSRTHGEIRDTYNALHPGDLIEQTLVMDYEENLQNMGILARSGQERSMAVMQRLRDARRLKAEEKEKKFNIFLMLFPIADPNVFLEKTVKYVRWLWAPEMVAVGFVLFGLTAAVFVRDFDRIWQQTLELYSFIGKPVIDVLQFYAIITLIAAFHELGHAYPMKIYGGDVHSIGFALFFFLPAYFTDTNDSELFENKFQRLWVTLGGIYVELYICVIATFLWVVSYPDTTIHDIAYKGMIYTGVSTVFFNVNPLTPTDGYHAVADMLEIPELRPESFHYIGMLIQKYIFRLPVDVPVLSKRKRRIFLIYGPLSILYMGSIMLAIFALINHIYGFFLGELATPLAILTAIRMFRKRLRKFTDVLRMFYLDKKEYLMSPKVKRRLVIGAVAAFVVLALPWPHETLEIPVRLRPSRVVRVAAPADATVAAVDVAEGDRVAAGASLARLASREVETHPSELQARAEAYAREASVSRESADAATSAAWQSKAHATETALAASRAYRDALQVRAPVAGSILTRRPQDMLGTSVAAGAPLFTVGDMGSMRVDIPVTERLLQSIRVGEPVSIRVQGLPFRTFRTTISTIAPAAETISAGAPSRPEALRPGERPERFVAVAYLDNRDGRLHADMDADARLLGKRTPYLVQWWKVFYYWTRRILW